MPAADLTIADTASGASSATGGDRLAILGPCSLGTANTVYELSSDALAPASLGDGALTELTMAVIREAQKPCIAVPLNTTVAGTIGSVTETPAGTGPTITAAQQSGTSGPYDSLDVAVKITTEGVNGAAQFRVSLDDGVTYGDVVEVPVAVAASMTGTVDLTGVDLSTLNTLTFIADYGSGNETCTFSGLTSGSSISAVASQITAAHSSGTASVVAGKIRIASNATGAAAEITIGSGTSNSALGFTAAAEAAGRDAEYDIPKLGVTLGFPSSSAYVLDTIYTFSTTQPKATTANVAAAITALQNSGVAFDLIVLAQEEADAASDRAYANQLATSAASLLAGKIPIRCMKGCGVDVTDSTLSTEFEDADAKRVLVTAGDCYINGGSIAGQMRRPSSWAAAIRAAKERFSSDLGNHADGGLSYVQDITRDEYTATTKLRPKRFVVIETIPNESGFHFVRGVTLAALGSKFADFNLCRVMDQATRIVQTELNREINNDPVLNADGTIYELDAKRVEKRIDKKLRDALVRPQNSLPHLSNVSVTVNRANNIRDTRNLSATFTLFEKGQQESVSGTIGYATGLEGDAA